MVIKLSGYTLNHEKVYHIRSSMRGKVYELIRATLEQQVFKGHHLKLSTRRGINRRRTRNVNQELRGQVAASYIDGKRQKFINEFDKN